MSWFFWKMKMTNHELIAALAELRSAIANDIRNRKGVGGTTVLPPDNPFIQAANRLGWHASEPLTIYTLLKAIESAHAQINIELFRDGESETARHMLAAIAPAADA